MIYPYFSSLLRPNANEHVLVKDQSCAIPKIELQFRRWDGISLNNTLNGKPLIDFDGHPVFAELCLYKLMRLSDWQARWIEIYGSPTKAPRLLTTWDDDRLTVQQHRPITDPWVASLLQRIAAANVGTYAGCWDVVGWYQGQLVFAELKRRKQDRIRATQLGWLEAALQLGLQPHNFLLVEWDFAS